MNPALVFLNVCCVKIVLHCNDAMSSHAKPHLLFSLSSVVMRCHAVNLNGWYYRTGRYNGSHDNGIVWSTWHGMWYSLKYSAMKIRPPFFVDRESGDGENSQGSWNLLLWKERNYRLKRIVYVTSQPSAAASRQTCTVITGAAPVSASWS